MTNQQLYFAIGVPSFLVILSWITNLIQNNRIDTKIDTLGNTLRAEMRADRKELTDRIDHLGESIRTDLKEFFKLITDLDKRVTRIEDKQ